MKVLGIFEKDMVRNHPSSDYIAEFGIPQNTLFVYMPTTFLNCAVNYIKIFSIIMIERYVKFTKKIAGRMEARITQGTFYNYSSVDDDVIIFAESTNSYWILWADRDTSDCCIGRIEKKYFKSSDEFKKAFIKWLRTHSELDCGPSKNKECITGRYIELPIPFPDGLPITL